ncbi:FAD:protein FMN transferase [Arthrobacter sp. SLBN-122]|uniref:FAD:protein FMN transferase n=1 Tax=Arthrobacter sp. SLBN-122 TaxID=2768455 RepID=UPI001167ADF4|nr:FAD:protein FMN transferase [Arthrobacter sp. SLBN-122]TQJ35940.1 thiamine biosynthesis lipoprotein [Arthrobacter sp. SLBN-122]
MTVTDPGMLAAAEGIVRGVLAAVDLACSCFRGDSELMRLQPLMAAGVSVSPMFRLLLERALEAAEMTDGDVDPSLGTDLAALGHGPGLQRRPGLQSVPVPSPHLPHTPTPEAPTPDTLAPRLLGWSRIHLDAAKLTVPAGLRLDLGASAKAVAADLAAAKVHRKLGCGVLVNLGGDLASAGPGPCEDAMPGQWQILVQDLAADPAQQVSLAAGFALATSSTQKRRWTHHGIQVHHILDPRFGLPAEPVWRSVTVAAPTCLQANAFSTAAIVRGFAAVEWFRTEGIPARLVDSRGRITTTGGWPVESSTPVEAADAIGGVRHG